MKYSIKRLLTVLGIVLTGSLMNAQVEVDVNFDLRHVVGGEDNFDREKFITLHAGATENDYNVELPKLDSLLVLYGANYGRETGRMRFLSSQVTEDPNRPGFADPASITARGNQLNTNYSLFQTGKHSTQNRGRLITAAQDRPFFPDGTLTDSGNFAFSTANGPADDDFGTATGEFMGIFVRDAYGDDPNSGLDGPPRPTWVEAINEPFFPLFDFTNDTPATVDEIFEFHRSVAREVRRFNPDVLVGGFTNAFPDLQFFGGRGENQQIFGQWEQRWEEFIDTTGDDMDFYSVHLYDFPSIGGGLEILRKGGNIEAVLDMIEHYNTIRWGSVKPWVISEYGSQLNDFFRQNWTPGRDWFILRAFSSMMMQFMERPDVIDVTIPFVLTRAEFLYGGAANPGYVYPWRMMRRAEELPLIGPLTQANLYPPFPNFTAPVDQEYAFTEIIKFYELWADVNGTRVDTKSTDLDIMVDAYVDTSNNKAHLILNSLDETDLLINLNQVGLDSSNIAGGEILHLFLGNDGNPTLTRDLFTTLPETVTLAEEGTMIIEYDLNNTPVVDGTSEERKIYALSANPSLPVEQQGDVFPRDIQANQPITFTIPGVTLGDDGEAVLRLGIGRQINTPLIPTVTVNGIAIQVPTDYRGDNQSDRASRGNGQNIFFGMLEAEVSYDLLVAGDNTVVVTFPDNGGAVSSCALQTFEFSRPVERTEGGNRTRAITFDNRTDFIEAGDIDPTVEINQALDITVTYSTGAVSGVEEDLFFVATFLRLVDNNGATVRDTAFTTSVPGSAANFDTANYQYTIPEQFQDGSPVLPSSQLTNGQSYVLVIFMSVDDNGGFVNANAPINIVSQGALSIDSFGGSENAVAVVYPNPASSNVTISNAVFNSWSLYGISGKKIMEGNETSFSVAVLNTGIYYLVLDNKTVLKVVKE